MTAICLLMDRSTFLSFAIYFYIYYDKSVESKVYEKLDE